MDVRVCSLRDGMPCQFEVLNEVNMPWSSEGHFGLYCFLLAFYSHLIGHYG